MAAKKQSKSEYHSDISAAQVRMARAALGWTWKDLTEAAEISGDTIARLERGEELRPRTLAALREAFEAAGIEFIPENGGGPGVRLTKRKRK